MEDVIVKVISSQNYRTFRLNCSSQVKLLIHSRYAGVQGSILKMNSQEISEVAQYLFCERGVRKISYKSY